MVMLGKIGTGCIITVFQCGETGVEVFSATLLVFTLQCVALLKKF